MGKKILIFADGTGNVGGLLPDESRTNVYKLYRATRTGPDSPIDPAEQIAFYIKGIGTKKPGEITRFFGIREIFEQAIGQGLKQRICECYMAVIGNWRPGDTIYLFGFSRGAYTVRCVAHILELYGIPTKEPGSETLGLHPKRLQKIATRAVNGLYRLGFLLKDSPRRREHVERFHTDYAPCTGVECGAIPYFLGIWDSVASYGLGQLFPNRYDPHLPHDIKYTRHALSIDENRKSFARVQLGGSILRQKQSNEFDPLQQVWFAGNHSDIGGSYPENESRLSDISLSWMLNFIANEVPAEYRIAYNSEMLQLFPYADGMMHDECQSSNVPWFKKLRDIDKSAELHPSVIERMNLSEAREYSGYKLYRPERLRYHNQVKSYYPLPAKEQELIRLPWYRRAWHRMTNS